MSIGGNIKRIRKEKGLTQQQLADAAGVAINSIRGYESENREPRRENLEAIACALGVTVKDLREDNPCRPNRVIRIRRSADAKADTDAIIEAISRETTKK